MFADVEHPVADVVLFDEGGDVVVGRHPEIHPHRALDDGKALADCLICRQSYYGVAAGERDLEFRDVSQKYSETPSQPACS
jgi:hypothetical protein